MLGWREKTAGCLAAMLLLALGLVGSRLADISTPPLPRGLELALVTRHDLCASLPRHQMPGVPQASIW